MKTVVISSIVTQKYLVLHYYTMSLQRIRIIVGDAGFEPGTSASEVWCAKLPIMLEIYSKLQTNRYRLFLLKRFLC